jgi:hypothetical protein
MPTSLPPRRPEEAPDGTPDPGFRNVMIAGACLLAVLGLTCEKFYPPTPGYSLARSTDDIQLSP